MAKINWGNGRPPGLGTSPSSTKRFRARVGAGIGTAVSKSFSVGVSGRSVQVAQTGDFDDAIFSSLRGFRLLHTAPVQTRLRTQTGQGYHPRFGRFPALREAFYLAVFVFILEFYL